MESRRTRRFLIVAVALSLLIHLVVAFVWRGRRVVSTPGIETVHLEHRTLALATATPPPPPPKRTPAPRIAPSTRPRPSRPRGFAAGTGRATPAPTAPPTPAPSPVATRGACAQANLPAALVSAPDPPIIPAAARAQGTSGTTVVRVQLDPHGAVGGTAIAQSSGNPALDDIAVTLAGEAQYSPALRDCKGVVGSYDFSVEFSAW